MLQGTVTAENFVNQLIEEIDITLPQINKNQYYEWINTELFHIYSSAVRCIGVNEYQTIGNIIDLNQPFKNDDFDFDIDFDIDVMTPKFENCTAEIDDIAFEDVYKVYGADNIEYVKSTFSSLAPNGKYFYFKRNGKLCISYRNVTQIYIIMFYMRPSKITSSNASEYIIPLPDAFLDVIRAKIRSEVFLLSGNPSMANAWSERHALLFDNLKNWHKEKEADYIR